MLTKILVAVLVAVLVHTNALTPASVLVELSSRANQPRAPAFK